MEILIKIFVDHGTAVQAGAAVFQAIASIVGLLVLKLIYDQLRLATTTNKHEMYGKLNSDFRDYQKIAATNKSTVRNNQNMCVGTEMKKSTLVVVMLLSMLLFGACGGKNELPAKKNAENFVDIPTVIPSIQLDIRYSTADNFVGARINGYDAPKCYLTREAAGALKNVQAELARNNRSLKIFDCYRPQRAVDHFVQWAKNVDDQKMKAEYYPTIDKRNLFKDGYIAAKSGHSRGSTVDLTIVDLTTNRELDMGTGFDFFDPLTHTVNSHISASQQENRYLLKRLMERHGFKNLDEEWWHYTLKNEPFADTSFDFPVE